MAGTDHGVVLAGAAVHSRDPVERLAGLAAEWVARLTAVPAVVFHGVGANPHETAPPVVVHWPGGPDAATLAAIHDTYVERYGRSDPLGVPRFSRSGWTVVSAAQAGGAGEIARSGVARALLAPYGIEPLGAMFLRDHGRIAARILVCGDPGRTLGPAELGMMRGTHPVLEHALICSRATRETPQLDELLRRARLTPREREVALHTVSGATNEEIARALSVSPATVKTHLVHVFDKLGVQTRAELVATLLMAQSPPPWRFPRTSSGSPSTSTAR